ncbi:hypothetical protein TNCV_1298131 [Trichonephila clavipes]|nr:hypothetical protein TNCV_1298131 [Trichonephila clavipes]
MLALTQPISSNSSWQIENPPYSLDLNPLDIFLFPRLKPVLKGKIFGNIPDIQRNVTRLWNSLPKVDFLQSLQDMYSKSQWFIVMEGEYFEGM